ncbi:hypothetical protein PV10_09176 [Exophiala mesophila]|uniref:Uncharacterized protein n=1 Tax=Exophiala mesophila TaxID=212818 RepID=A0A0D1YZJ4_EXOME|nr:uncharacterized protein PV10_09176 [Exophiala mesophila]KIV87997.1 hypothetical protein PV10_09176 [Exophiala mesophila]
MSDTSKNQTFNPPGHDTWSPTYSHISSTPISATHNLISFAGQVGGNSSTHHVPGTLGEQVALALSNVDRCMAAAGATKADIIQVRQYVVNLLPQDPVRAKLYTEWLGDAVKPPSTLIGVQSLAAPELLYEIEVVAVVESGRG